MNIHLIPGLDLGRPHFKPARLLVAALFLASYAGASAAQQDKAYAACVPKDKKLDPKWVESLTAKGERKIYRGDELKYIAMPCGGIGAGQIEITGDGTLGSWWIFNEDQKSNRGNGYGNGWYYLHPQPVDKPVEHGFAIRIAQPGKPGQVLELSRKDFDDLSFIGEYPIATLEYRKSGTKLPVAIQSEVFSPFVPLSVRDSANPVTVLRYSITNTSDKPLEISVAGWLQNHTFPQKNDTRISRVVREKNLTAVQHGLQLAPDAAASIPVPVDWDDFESPTYADHWTVEGDAFAGGPANAKAEKFSQPLSGYHGSRMASSFPGEGKENLQGKLISKPFRISRKHILFSIAGGKFPGATSVNLKVDGKVELTETGDNSNTLRPIDWDVAKWMGKEAVLEIVDERTGGWGFVHADNFRFVEDPNSSVVPRGNGHTQYGDLALSVLDPEAQAAAFWPNREAFLSAFSTGKVQGEESRAGSESGIGSVCSTLVLEPGQTRQVTFVVSWWFPNSRRLGLVGHIYNNWHMNSVEAASYVADNFERLYSQTRLFRDTYFDTTLPYWLANRIIMPVSTLASDNVCIFENGRFYAHEGVGFCPGTCGHVYNFVNAVAMLFPELERSTRLQQDLDERFGFDPASGRINFRGHDGPNPEAGHAYASDAQSGYVLKLYREHLMSRDRKFLDSVWPKVKQVIGYQIFLDGAGRGLEPNGVLEGLQTMWDPMWYGPNPYNETLYLAALRAAEEMARIEGENALADRYHAIFVSGQKFMNERMWNGDYYVHLYPQGFRNAGSTSGVVTPKDEQANAAGFIKAFNQGTPHYYVSTACDAQQLFGQTWADRLGMGRILPEDRCRSAAASIFLHNWTPDIATVYKLYPPHNRTLGAFGEAGLVNGAWPVVARQPFENCHDKDDLWTGLEYQAACDMLSAGLLQEGLTVIRAVDERYDAKKRNPWNEVEGAEHYSRAMHSWSILLTLSGFTCDGPAGMIGFAPKITPDNFKCFFSTAEGWGSFSQKVDAAIQIAAIDLKWGLLRLKEISLAPAGANFPSKVTVRQGSHVVPSQMEAKDGRIWIRLEKQAVIPAGGRLEIQLAE
jgi:non-lysosomal glucosylceramidase